MSGQAKKFLSIVTIASILTLCACSYNDASRTGAQAQSSAETAQTSTAYAAQLKQALQSATSDFERKVLKRSIKAGKISESDYRQANEKYQQCMVLKGNDIEFTTDQSTGLMQESMSVADDSQDYDSEKVSSDSISCAKGTNLLIRDLYERMATNPSNADEIELIVNCLKRKNLVSQSFTKQDFLTEDAKPQGSSKLDTDSDEYSQCLANPNK